MLKKTINNEYNISNKISDTLIKFVLFLCWKDNNSITYAVIYRYISIRIICYIPLIITLTTSFNESANLTEDNF